MSEIRKPIMLDETGKEIVEALKGISRHAETADMASDSEKLGGKEPSEYLGTGDVPEWAKQPNKPTYSASEVGALPSDGKAVDSDKLNGHPASDFATTATMTALADDVSVSKAELVVLGWNVPSGMTLKNTVENGVFTQKVGRIDLGSLSWVYNHGDTFAFFSTEQIPDLNHASNLKILLCSRYIVENSVGDLYYGRADKIMVGTSSAISSRVRLYIRDTSYDNNNDFKNSLKGVYLYYELAEYKTYTLADYPSTDIKSAELQTLGWFVPSEMPLKNTLANGVLTQYVGRVDMGGFYWNPYLQTNTFYASIVGIKLLSKLYCEGFEQIDECWDKSVDNSISSHPSINNIYARLNSSYSSSESFRNAVKGKYLYFELATPITYNSTDMPSQKSMISDEWDGTKTYAVGDFCIYQNRLYKALIANVGQNPLTSTTYWQMVKVTDFCGTTFVGSVGGRNPISIDSQKYGEFIAITVVGDTVFTHTLISAMMVDSARYSLVGSASTSSYPKESEVKYTKSYIMCNNIFINNSDRINDVTTYVYGRN